MEEINYQISVKIKNSHWYKVAEEYGGIKEFEEWDDGKTIRYKRGLTFKFKHPVASLEEFPKSNYELSLCNRENNDVFITVKLNNVRLLKCKGEIESNLVISESICDQDHEVKKELGKKYVYYYLKDVEIHEVLPNLWLSSEHYKQLQNESYNLISVDEVEILAESGYVVNKTGMK